MRMLARLILGLFVLKAVVASPRFARQVELDTYDSANYDVDLENLNLENQDVYDYEDGRTIDEPKIEIGTLAPPDYNYPGPGGPASLEEEEEEELPLRPQLIPQGSGGSGLLMGPDAQGEEELRLSPIDILHISGDFGGSTGSGGSSGSGGSRGSGGSGDFLASGSGDLLGSGGSGASGEIGSEGSGDLGSGGSEDLGSGGSGGSGDLGSGGSGGSRDLGSGGSGGSGDLGSGGSGGSVDLGSGGSGDLGSGGSAGSGDLGSGGSGGSVDLGSGGSGGSVDLGSGTLLGSGGSGDILGSGSGGSGGSGSRGSGDSGIIIISGEEELPLIPDIIPQEVLGASGESGASGTGGSDSGGSEVILIPDPEEEEELLLTTPKTPQESGGTVGSGGSGLPEVDLDIKGMPTCLLCTCLGGSVYCDDVKLTSVPPLPKETTHFYARYNHITKINKGDFAQMNKLKRIDLTANEIASIADDAFSGLPVLEELVLRENRVAQLPALPPMMTLVDASHNNIGATGIHKEAFKDMTGLLYLYLTDNHINHIPVPLPDSLRSLHLQRNNIQMIHEDTFCNLKDFNYIRNALEDIRLDGNPINLSRTPQAYVCLPRVPIGAHI
ncbi:leucine-rich repeat protein soc-2 homolog [Coregonus clupeaformis]|uniref:leucine-rich repeat protein soc-2 homolog n=1 Tax=Coregonus clupeaformis TaxID=59861 RepID=UPI001BDFE135|nr:leucine-rich repeat protein soc-2 homolog [Coregonus clupeaformis]XP_041709220.1 leucine-rich repeat protein soc-2 homolog [Coregonus clupeaformis]